MNFDGLKRDTITVRDEWRERWNTANRIGTLFLNIVNALETVYEHFTGKTDALSTAKLADAPDDGKLYGRRNGQWVEIDTAVPAPSPTNASPTPATPSPTPSPEPTPTPASGGTPEPGGTPVQQVWYSAAAGGRFTRNDCGTGYTGSTVTFGVPAGQCGSTVSQADADAKAQAYVAANGQAYANAHGTCTLISPTQAPTQAP